MEYLFGLLHELRLQEEYIREVVLYSQQKDGIVKVPAFVVYAEPFVVVFHHLAYVFDILKFFAYPTLYLDYLKKDKKDGWRLWISKYGPLLGVCRDTPILYSCIIWIICSFYVESWAGCGQCCCTENFRRETKTRKKGLVNHYIDKP
jgi:hypothetical protein